MRGLCVRGCFLLVASLMFLAGGAVAASPGRLGALFIASDASDVAFSRGLGVPLEVAMCIRGGSLEGYGLVLVLDYNVGWGGCPRPPRGFFEELVRVARSGGVVVLGYNTLRAIMAYDPGLIVDLGLASLVDAGGVHSIIVSRVLVDLGAPERLTYNSARYLRFIVLPHTGWRVLAVFDDGSPAIVEERVGRGRLVLLLFNPVWPALEGYRGYTGLVKALYQYYTQRLALAVPVAAVAAAAVAAAASVAAAQRSDEAARRIGRPLVFLALLAHRVSRKSIGEHPVRGKILSILEEKPYITVQDLVSQGIRRSSALWHLELMVSLGVLSFMKVAGKNIYYMRGREREALLAFLMESRHRRRIIEELATGVYTLTRLAQRLGISKSTIKHHIDLLLRLGIVTEAGQGYTLSEWARNLLLRRD